MKRIIILIILAFTSTLHSQWTQQTSGITQAIYDIWMISNNNVVACGEGGKLLRTTDGGVTWNSLSSGTANSLNSICFVNSFTGFIYGSSVLLKTTDSGASWNNVGVNVPAGSGQASFIDASRGWITTNGPTVEKTTNGGLNWTFEVLPVSSQGYDICFVDQNTGYICGTKPVPDSTYIYKTINGGTTWTVLHGEHVIYDKMFVRDISNIYLCGYFGEFTNTNDGGVSWERHDLPNTIHGQDMMFINDTLGYVCGDEGRIFATFNRGLDWHDQSIVIDQSFNGITFLPGSNAVGYIAGNDGVLYKTTNGGVIGIQQTGYEVPSGFSLSQNYPNPFNPTTNIKFNISKAGQVKLDVFDVTGREVAQLVNDNLKPGTYNYDFDASHLSSGIYFYKMQTNEFSEVKKMILVK